MAYKKNKKKSKSYKGKKTYSAAEKRAFWVGYGEGSIYNSEFKHNPNYENPKLVAAAQKGFDKGKYDFYNRDDPTKNYDVFGLFGSRLKPRKKDIR